MKRLLLILLLVCSNVWAAGTAGLLYDTYAAGGAMPSYTQASDGTITNRTKLSSGTVSIINYQWGGGGVLNSGRSEGVIVRFYGFIEIPTAGTYYFGGQADDGIRIRVNNTQVVDSWIESGGAFRSGSITLAAGVVPIELIYYENGGGAMVNLQWYQNNTWQLVPSTALATDSTYWAPAAPVLCCGGSSSSFNASPSNVTKINTFTSRTTADSQVYIEQIGNDNILDITQEGTRNNYINYYNTGSFNDVTIKQVGVNSSQTNYVDLTVTGNSNTVDIKQRTSSETNSFGKGVYATIANDNNTVTIDQRNSGSHYLNLDLSGGNKTIDITQQGSANHMADITLGGAGARSLSLTQQGTTQQFYSINSTCASSCQAITVIQGQ